MPQRTQRKLRMGHTMRVPSARCSKVGMGQVMLHPLRFPLLMLRMLGSPVRGTLKQVLFLMFVVCRFLINPPCLTQGYPPGPSDQQAIEGR